MNTELYDGLYKKPPLDELYHHGVQGQKWGVRNGPPYPLSRQKKGNGRLASGKGSISKKKSKKVHGEKGRRIWTANVLMKDLETGRRELTYEERRRLYEITKGMAFENLDKINKKSDTKEIKKAKDDFRDVNLLTENNYNERYTDKDTLERANKAADLGLEALNKIGRDGYDPKEGITDIDRDWFIIEDQTIGLATIADLVNQGKSKSEIQKLINSASILNKDDDYSYKNGIFQLSYNSGDYEKPYVDEFIDSCIKVKKESDKKKGK